MKTVFRRELIDLIIRQLICFVVRLSLAQIQQVGGPTVDL